MIGINAALEDEITSINAIYTHDTFHTSGANDFVYVLSIQCAEMSLRLSFPVEYPDLPPEILGPETTSTWNRKGEANEVADLARDVLRETFRSGEPCIYDLLEELTAKLQDRSKSLQKDNHAQVDRGTDGGHRELRKVPKQQRSPGVDKSLVPEWSLSEVVAEKKSIFVARAAHVNHPTEAKLFLQHLLNTDKKVAKATHNITAWRMRGSRLPDVTFQDCNDDGETAAGARLLHLLQVMDVWDMMVVVSRWYGGIQLGPDRFRIINYVARDALVRSGSECTGKNNKDKKGKN